MPDPRPADPQLTVTQPTKTFPPADAADGSTHDVTGAYHSAASTVPGADDPPADNPLVAGYTVVGEIARGGMGRVLAAHDQTLDREVALKVLLPGANATRFETESKITAKLQHPNIPPVYALGTLADGSPFLAMKRIRGRTLAADLKSRDHHSDHLPRFVQVFEGVCQAVGYAHSRGVIHRDLKPANVMVGEFGEVQVMDWGLARVFAPLSPGGRGAGGEGDGERNPLTPSPSPAGGEGGQPGLTHAGAILGTPNYMAPEQARGEPTDARADVFALGGILTAILTGRSVFSGDSVNDTITRAAAGDTADALARLRECGADPELVAVATACLQFHRKNRPADGLAVAQLVSGYRNGVEERLRRAETARATAAAEAVEYRKRRRVQVALATAVGLMVVGGGAFAVWQERQSADRKVEEQRAQRERERIEADSALVKAERDTEARLKGEQARQAIRASLAVATDLRAQFKFKEAGAVVAQATELAESGAPDMAAGVSAARRDVTAAARLDDVRYSKWQIIGQAVTKEEGASSVGNRNNINGEVAVVEYPKAFAAFGFDPLAGPADEAARVISASAIRDELLAAIDDWAIWEHTPTTRDRLLEVARRVDPGDWNDRLRTADNWTKADELNALAGEAGGAAPARAVTMLAVLMHRLRLDPVPLLDTARTRAPANFDLTMVLGLARRTQKGSKEVGEFEAARALRPDSYAAWNGLGLAWLDRGEYAQAEAALTTALALAPKYDQAINNLALLRHSQGQTAEARKLFRRCLDLDGKSAMYHNGMGITLHQEGDHKGAVGEYEKAVAIDPRYAMPFFNMGVSLRALGDTDGAIKAYKTAADLDRTDPRPHNNLGNLLRQLGDYPAAIAACQKAIELDPDMVFAHNNLGFAHHLNGNQPAALASYEKALELNPRYAPAHVNVGWAAKKRGDMPAAIKSYKKAIECDPKLAQAHYNLGGIYFDQKKFAEAIACAKGAVEANPKYANAYALLGESLWNSGDTVAARAALETAAKLDKKWQPRLAQLPAVETLPPPRPAQER